VSAGQPVVKFLVLHSATFDLSRVRAELAADRVGVAQVAGSGAIAVADCPTVLVLDPPARDEFTAEALKAFLDRGGAIVAVGAEREADPPEWLEKLLSGFLPAAASRRLLLLALRSAFRDAAGRADALRSRTEASSRAQELRDFARIAMAVSAEHDLGTLLEMILTYARQVTQSDAGSLYLVERKQGEPAHLTFKLAQGHSRPNTPLVEHTIPIDHTSIAGYVASTGEHQAIADAYDLSPDAEYTFNRSFDERYRYRTKSILTIPMRDHKNQIIGVVQLINRKRDADVVLDAATDFERQVIPYSKRTLEMVSALAAQAAVAIENSRLYRAIGLLFEGFVRAAVTAIEQRDPPTQGHSWRVAESTVRLAEAVDQVADGPLRDITFTSDQLREIRYAGLLHDFGKVGVREEVLVKAKKLYEPQLQLIHQRYGFVRRTLERDFYRRRVEYLEQSGAAGYREFLESLETEHQSEITDLDHFLEMVLRANEPTILPEGNFDELLRFHELRYRDVGDCEQPLLTGEELRSLSIRKGSLDDNERREIEAHVKHTFDFLLNIPWTNELRDIPRIAYGHHEKLDGSGYPEQVRAPKIPPQTRMMTISDIFDALTAQDRPYKHKLPVPRALGILEDEVKAGQLDPELFEVFVATKAYEKQSA
jgi:HD-GYP domain-containing protein (c-di-GMP phosphodiesterase class II)